MIQIFIYIEFKYHFQTSPSVRSQLFIIFIDWFPITSLWLLSQILLTLHLPLFEGHLFLGFLLGFWLLIDFLLEILLHLPWFWSDYCDSSLSPWKPFFERQLNIHLGAVFFTLLAPKLLNGTILAFAVRVVFGWLSKTVGTSIRIFCFWSFSHENLESALLRIGIRPHSSIFSDEQKDLLFGWFLETWFRTL